MSQAAIVAAQPAGLVAVHMFFSVLAVVVPAQITVLSPADLLPRLPHTAGYVVGTTAVFGAPYYGQTLRGRSDVRNLSFPLLPVLREHVPERSV